jgi:hypothetical protein
MTKKLYITMLLGLLSILLSSPACIVDNPNDCHAISVQHVTQQTCEQQDDYGISSISKGSDVYAVQVVQNVTVPQSVSERTVRTYSCRSIPSFATSLGRRVRNLTSFSKHCSWRIFSASTPFYCTTSKLFYVYALREIIR